MSASVPPDVAQIAATIYANALARLNPDQVNEPAFMTKWQTYSIQHAHSLLQAIGQDTQPPTSGSPPMGVIDGSEATQGSIGEYLVNNSTTPVTLPSNTPLAISQISLTPGDWEVWGTIDFQPAPGVSPNGIAAAVSLYPDALPTDTDLMTGIGVLNMFTTSSLTSGQRQVLMTGTCRSNSATPITLFLVGQTTLGGTGTLSADGYICARRMR